MRMIRVENFWNVLKIVVLIFIFYTAHFYFLHYVFEFVIEIIPKRAK